MVSQSLVSTREKAADKLARQGALLVPSTIPCSLSRLIFRIHSSLFSDWRRTASSKFFDTQVPSIFTEELVLSRQARCVLSRLHCNGHSLLSSSYLFNWQNREFVMQRMRTLVQGHLLCHPALSSYGIFASLALWRFTLYFSEGVGQQQQQQAKINEALPIKNINSQLNKTTVCR